mmetsp:Transcript_118868/g.272714  ORF Transcript_118868/g.272714 Transcript_118868/m.272714 type:complete len:220 (+) Transcript_118868:639-1298(+)
MKLSRRLGSPDRSPTLALIWASCTPRTPRSSAPRATRAAVSSRTAARRSESTCRRLPTAGTENRPGPLLSGWGGDLIPRVACTGEHGALPLAGCRGVSTCLSSRFGCGEGCRPCRGPMLARVDTLESDPGTGLPWFSCPASRYFAIDARPPPPPPVRELRAVGDCRAAPGLSSLVGDKSLRAIRPSLALAESERSIEHTSDLAPFCRFSPGAVASCPPS